MPTVPAIALLEIRNELDTGEVHRRSLLRRLVEGMEVERERARLWYTFPLSQVGGLSLVPLEECCTYHPLSLRLSLAS